MKTLVVVAFAPILLIACSPIPRPGSWQILGQLPLQLSSVQHSLGLRDGRMLILGTYQPSPAAPPVGAAAGIFDPHNRTWAIISPPPVLASGETLTLLDDGSVLLSGGESFAPGTRAATMRSAYIYLPDRDQWTRTADMIQSRAYFTSTRLIDGRVLVAGGEADGRSLSSCEFYDPRLHTWSEAPSLPTRRVYQSSALLSDGSVVLAGGDLDTSSGINNPIRPGQSPGSFPYRSEEVFRPKSETWSELDPPQPVEDPTVVPLPGGDVLFTGGHFGKDPSPFMYLYDPSTGAWSQRADSKGGGYPALLKDGRLLFPFPPYTYDPSQDQWMPATSPPDGLFVFGSPVALNDGLVLSLVGAQSFALPRLSVALYDPSGFPPLPGSLGPLADPRLSVLLAAVAILLLGLVVFRRVSPLQRPRQ